MSRRTGTNNVGGDSGREIEIRTSRLLLARGLAKNKQKNLSEEQVEAAQLMHGSGTDLLNLINEIPDLSKIEAGRMDLRMSKARVADIADNMRVTFALTRSLEACGMQTVKAPNGAKALHALDQQPDMDIVKMDIMMPVMDGYEAMERIRFQERFQALDE